MMMSMHHVICFALLAMGGILALSMIPFSFVRFLVGALDVAGGLPS